MNLIVNIYFYLWIGAIEALYLRSLEVTNLLHGGGKPTRKFDHFRFSSRRDDHVTENANSKTKEASTKRIILIRHGQTYMNELIGGGGIKFGQPNFTDIFPNPEDQKKYHDSPLSEVGIEQARALNSKLRGLNDNTHGCFNAFGDPLTNITNTNFLGDLDLVVVSPLTRALQTLELSLYDHILNENENGHHIPIVAVAAAAERLYLVSDVWKARSELMSNYPFVDFDAEFHIDGVCSDFTSECASQKEENLDAWHFSPTKSMEEGYSEWRPHGQGQKYACLGEPSDYFDRRMSNFYYWLESREEKCIAIVCHAGVIEWMTSGEQFYNCELRVQAFSSLQPRSLQGRKTQSN